MGRTTAFLRTHWLTLLTTALGFALAYYFYSKSVSRREPMFVVDPNRVRLLDSARLSVAPIRVLRPDGGAISRDLSIATFYFWNAGREPIRHDDILEPLRIELVNPSVRILGVRLVRASRPVNHFEFRLDTTTRRSVDLGFQIAEQDDGVAGQLIFEGSPDAPLMLTGTIVGARSIGTPQSVGRGRLVLGLVVEGLKIIGLLGLMALSMITIDKLQESKRRQVALHPPGPKAKAAARRGSVAALVSLGVLIIILGGVVYSKVKEEVSDDSYQSRTAQLMTRVPPNLRADSLSPAR